jgi:hypothetical protein
MVHYNAIRQRCFLSNISGDTDPLFQNDQYSSSGSKPLPNVLYPMQVSVWMKGLVNTASPRIDSQFALKSL